MNKAESLKALKKWGFNTPEFVIVKPGRYLQQLPSMESETFSIRTCTEGKAFSCPFLRNISKYDVYSHVERLTRDGYTVIVSPWHLREWSLYSAHVLMETADSGLVEYIQGPSIVRDVANAKGLRTLVFRNLDSVPEPFQGVVQECSAIRQFYEKSCIVELSLMDRDVGYMKERLLFWEVRDG